MKDLQTLGPYALKCLFACLAFALVGCSTTPSHTQRLRHVQKTAPRQYIQLASSHQASDIVLYSLGLLNQRYRFGGNHPSVGLDCSGMVSFIVNEVSKVRLPHNAAMIAQSTKPIPQHQLQPGDLVFFNTGKKHSHMGIYIGQRKFVHASTSTQAIKVSSLDNPYFSRRLDGVTTLRPI